MIDERAPAFFGQLSDRFKEASSPRRSVVVFHAVDSARYFLPALDKVAPIEVAIPKPGSVDSSVIDWLDSHNIPVSDVDRTQIVPSVRDGAIARRLSAFSDPVVVVDIGGYFAPAVGDLAALLGERLLGIVEDTENGIQKYETAGDLPCEVRSVARSPLKRPEDHLVGVAVVYSVEACLRAHANIVNGREACVVGYGKVGRGAAHALRDRMVATKVYETDPVRAVEALSDGFIVPGTLEEALSGTTIVVSATGAKALGAEELLLLENGAFLASVTSADDEFKASAVDVLNTSDSEVLGEGISKHWIRGRYFYALNRGNAVNFLHKGALGPFIYLVQSEILANVASIEAPGRSTITELPTDRRRELAADWRLHFTN